MIVKLPLYTVNCVPAGTPVFVGPGFWLASGAVGDGCEGVGAALLAGSPAGSGSAPTKESASVCQVLTSQVLTCLAPRFRAPVNPTRTSTAQPSPLQANSRSASLA